MKNQRFGLLVTLFTLVATLGLTQPATAADRQDDPEPEPLAQVILPAQTWLHVNASDTIDQAGVYTGSDPQPGARYLASSWADSAGNLWLFGGSGRDSNGASGLLNDLWKYNPATDLWSHESGSDTVNESGVYTGAAADLVPGARLRAMAWESNGNLWLFGGYGYNQNGSQFYLNDLWKYNLASGLWTHEGGSATVGNLGGVYTGAAADLAPGGRHHGSTTTDSTGNLWLFGGVGYDASPSFGSLNDLWKYDVSSGFWTYESGSDIVDASGKYTGGDEVPGARISANLWPDAAGNLWLFAGQGYDKNGAYEALNDLWKYDPSGGTWTHEGGSDTINASGVYSGGNEVPGARSQMLSWSDSAGNLWLFGGYGKDKNGTSRTLNDLWKYTLSTDTWTHEGGETTVTALPVYTTGNANPGARLSATGWRDKRGTLWLFGGQGKDKNEANGRLNDLWKYNPKPTTPLNLQATDGNSSAHVKVEWDGVFGATYYKVYRYNGTSWVKIAEPTTWIYKDTATTPLATYKYKVKACNTNGCSAMSTLATGYRGKLVNAQLVRNFGFEIDTDKDGIPNFWTRASNNGLDKRICSPAAKYAGNCGYRLLGDGATARDWVRQNLSAKASTAGGGHNGDKLILSFYARSLRLELADGAYVLVKVRNSATNKQQVIRVNLTGTHAYKRFTKTLKVTIGNYDQVWVYVYANGTATENLYVDNVTVRLQYIQTK